MKKIAVMIFPILLLLFFFTGCGEGTISYLNPDGSKTAIRYSSAVPFERAPYFEVSGRTLSMQFNGIVWYKAQILPAELTDAYIAGDLLAESSNLRVYANQGDDADFFPYLYLLDLDGTDGSHILFFSTCPPYDPGYGTDFTTSVSFDVDGTVTIPDTKGITVYMEIPPDTAETVPDETEETAETTETA